MGHAIVWFRNDLRLDDNPALRAALDAGLAPVCVYIHAPDEEGDWAPGAASNAWRHRSLAALDTELRRRGSRLRLFHGPTLATLQSLVQTCDAEAVFWNRRYDPLIETRDAAIKRSLRESGVQADSHNGALLFEPWSLQTGQGGPYKVFTPFWRKALSEWQLPEAWTAPRMLPKVDSGPSGVALDDLHLAATLPWDTGFWQLWQPGEAGAHEALEVFIDGAMRGYRASRDRPDQAGTSRLSPHLHFGEIAPWRVVAALDTERTAATAPDIDAYVRELGWREFSHHLLHHFPKTTEQDFNPRFKRFQWARADSAQIEAWRRGRTGVPIVDAGMRELWNVGWMHNRVRMIVGSWLCKHMRIHWREGARWFWDTLVDADLANNTLGWQWIGGTGADASPYFRVFNPVTQAEKFDPRGDYIASWVPELADLPMPLRASPWTDPKLLEAVAPGYPAQPIVDLAAGREAALAAYQASR
ncbi:cryptochrome/photolyase family protein [Luteimonas terrae]|uniref:Deoxyribodipyrimidine photo-lyase n=1 Tax=Luteimonas terrae TaxID=1530191 RepID=A0A4V3ANW1_9GAMM|nr:deoxyribodipyrimidine photo-lyase [Luteimonas terrae]TDK33132.1 deoxyribodipyrimidine photo-lyase [Luteimonas terrae]